ncbi:glycosyltransferase family protein [Winogradskyella sp. UBA3174]|uniref:glycosyltransferase family protein n=1 Tax=Winogradskyella sp. UBA3174 TaxID=1947785 RepID=UPI0025DBFE66|nr:glycosyltransferase [Winogradskyella sp. UBA3174]|tara:strand:+ start:33003 stop:34145 length:1143 start_codon:yes stop_codon:yes gene_type:complete
MKILLVGEYSRLHNSLKEGLEQLSHEVKIVANADGFKNYDVDYLITKKYRSGFLKHFKNLLYKVSGVDLESLHSKKQIINFKSKISNFDIVQFINEAPFGCTATIEKDIFEMISNWNKDTFLLSCGTDHISIKHAFEGEFRYSILTPYLEGKDKTFLSAYGLKYLQKDFEALHHYVFKTIKGVIASDIDYQMPLLDHPKYLGLIPNPINTTKLEFEELKVNGKIIIFHGINSTNYYKKGNDIFEQALDIIRLKFEDKVEILTIRSLPYKDYITSYNRAHILLDQVYAYDQGYNALEAMAKGKVVFTGAEKEWLDYYNVKEDTVAINALPDASTIAKKLEWLILNPDKVTEISRNAKDFIDTHHNYIKSAKKYLETWKVNA